jgi:hypothetical protein
VAENPYTRSINISVVELVPQKAALPQCTAWKKDLLQCENSAKYEVNGNPCCGVHLGKPDMIFMPVRLRKAATT